MGEFEHDAVAVVSVAGDYGQAVVVVYVQLQVFFVNLGDLFHGHHPLAVDDGHVEAVFQVLVDGAGGDLRGQAGGGAL